MDLSETENDEEKTSATPENDRTRDTGQKSFPENEEEWTHILPDEETENLQWNEPLKSVGPISESVDPNEQTRIAVPINGEEETILPKDGFSTPPIPLPKNVEEVDPDATRITPTAFQPAAPVQKPLPTVFTDQAGRARKEPSGHYRQGSSIKKNGKKKQLGCLIKGLIGLLLFLILILIGIGTFAVFQYFSIASTLPDVGTLKDKASQFETTRIYDRNGNLLYEMLDPNAGRRTYVALERVSPYLIAATLATEDKEYFNHPGFDPFAIGRALLSNYVSGEIVSGASTITQQLARTLLLSQQERYEQSYQRKAREIVLAAEITRQYSKEEILELYLNENYYGNVAYGIEAAAETYFNKTADKLELSEGAFLAGLPQAPAVYDVFTNREATYKRFTDVLGLIVATSQEKGCIFIGNTVQPVCVDAQSAAEAAISLEDYQFTRRENAMRYPHWVNFIRSQLEEQYGAQTIYRSGFEVYTTLDPELQDCAEQVVREQVSRLAANKVGDGALVAIEPSSGEILAMVGSADFYNEEIDGQVNMAVSPRQPGSSIKPLTYLAAFEKGWTPATLIWDVPSEFPPSGIESDPMPAYIPENYDKKFHGPVTVRTALANSYNIPAVKTLNFVRIYDDPITPETDGFINFAKRMGIETLDREDYGLALTLGGGDVSLLALTRAFSIIANNGVKVPLTGITRIMDFSGQVVFESQNGIGDQVIRPEHAYLISSILSDNEARKPMFGSESVLALPFPAAAKTGTTNDFRDNWTMGFTPELAVGVWVGNADYSPMEDTTGLSGAAPIWSEFMRYAVQKRTNGNFSNFYRPAGIEEKVICSVSGAEPSDNCPEQRTEIFASGQPPLGRDDDLWKNVNIDTWTGLLASDACQDFVRSKPTLNVTDPWAIKWIREDEKGREWTDKMGFGGSVFFTPTVHCAATDPHPMILFPGLNEDQVITSNPLDIYVVAKADDQFRDFRLEFGYGDDPEDWTGLMESDTPYEQPERVHVWDLSHAEEGNVTIRLVMNSTEDRYAEKRLHLKLAVPTVTPTITSTFEPTTTPTLEPTATNTETPTSTPEPSATTSP
ncbi:MAG: transglycosylase domain-containing protein [Anaerolineaceae bacterium]